MENAMKRISVLLLLGTFLFSCFHKDPIKVGLVADFSGRASQLATQARNALSMAINEINDDGGIGGRTLEFSIVDHKNDPDFCVRAVSQLTSEGVDIIIGPMMSGMAASVIEGAKESGTLIIGPTVSTDALTGIDDNFIRGVAPASGQGKFLARIVLEKELSKVAYIYDSKNKAYSDALLKGFDNEIMGCEECIQKIFSFANKDDFSALVEELIEMEPDGMVLVASGIDTAAIVQLYAKERDVPQLFTGSWAKVTNVTEYGGKAIEGMISVDSFANETPIEREKAFYQKYGKTFSIDPNIAAIATYESIMLYAAAVEAAGTTKSADVKEAILNMGEVLGIRDEFSIDEYGDGVRDLSTFIVRDGAHVLVKERN